MSYIHSLSNGDEYKTNFHNHALLGMCGCEVLQQEGAVTVNFTKANMSSAQVVPYLDALRGKDGMSCQSNGHMLTLTGDKAEFRHVSNLVAQKAAERGDTLGKALIGNVIKHGEKIDRHAAHTAFTQASSGLSKIKTILPGAKPPGLHH